MQAFDRNVREDCQNSTPKLDRSILRKSLGFKNKMLVVFFSHRIADSIQKTFNSFAETAFQVIKKLFSGKYTVKTFFWFESFFKILAIWARYSTGLSKLRYMILLEPFDDPIFFELRSVFFWTIHKHFSDVVQTAFQVYKRTFPVEFIFKIIIFFEIFHTMSKNSGVLVRTFSAGWQNCSLCIQKTTLVRKS